jgi:hypothetical protein
MNSWSWDGKLKDFDKLEPPAEVPLRGKMLIDCYRYAREWSAAASTFIG